MTLLSPIVCNHNTEAIVDSLALYIHIDQLNEITGNLTSGERFGSQNTKHKKNQLQKSRYKLSCYDAKAVYIMVPALKVNNLRFLS